MKKLLLHAVPISWLLAPVSCSDSKQPKPTPIPTENPSEFSHIQGAEVHFQGWSLIIPTLKGNNRWIEAENPNPFLASFRSKGADLSAIKDDGTQDLFILSFVQDECQNFHQDSTKYDLHGEIESDPLRRRQGRWEAGVLARGGFEYKAIFKALDFNCLSLSISSKGYLATDRQLTANSNLLAYFKNIGQSASFQSRLLWSPARLGSSGIYHWALPTWSKPLTLAEAEGGYKVGIGDVMPYRSLAGEKGEFIPTVTTGSCELPIFKNAFADVDMKEQALLNLEGKAKIWTESDNIAASWNARGVYRMNGSNQCLQIDLNINGAFTAATDFAHDRELISKTNVYLISPDIAPDQLKE